VAGRRDGVNRPLLRLVQAGAIVLATLVAFSPLRHARFLQDDHAIVQLNPMVHRGDFAEIFRTDYWAGVGGSELSLYRPVTIASFALERGPDGKVPPGRAHVTNLLLHAAVALGLWGLALRLRAGDAVALGAGFLFALHPVHLSVVAGLVGRAEILAALFTLAALLAWSAAGAWSADGRFEPSPGGIAPRAAAWGTAFAALLAFASKESAFALPLLLLAADLIWRAPRRAQLGRWCLERAAAVAPTALATVVYLCMRTAAIGSFPGTQRPRLSDNPLVGLDPGERFATALSLAWRTLRLMLLPRAPAPDYSGPVIPAMPGLAAAQALAGLAVLLGSAALLAAPLVRSAAWGGARARRLAYASALFLLPYAIVGNLFVLVGIIYAERLLYLPSLGFCMALPLVAATVLTALLARAPARLRTAVTVAVALAVFVPLGLFVRARTADWQTDATLWEAAVTIVPDSPRALFTLAKNRLDERREDEALALFERAATLWPAYSAAWFEQGQIQQRRGRADEALRCYREAVRRNPWNAEAAAAAASILFEQRRFADAERFYRRAIRLGRADLLPRWKEAQARAGAG